jgi:hypothetical protein
MPETPELFPLTGDVDPKILPLVVAMRNLGLNTFNSCEGHFTDEEFRSIRPFVSFKVTARAMPIAHDLVMLLSTSHISSIFGCIPEVIIHPHFSEEKAHVHIENWMICFNVRAAQSKEEAEVFRDEGINRVIAVLDVIRQMRKW